MSVGVHNGGSGKNGFGGDLDDLIKDRDEEFGIDWDQPGLGYDQYAGFDDRTRSSSEGGGFADRGTLEAISRIIETLSGMTEGALSPDARHQLEKILRDLLVVLRDSLDWMIDRIDERSGSAEVEIEEIPID
ncbi:MAG: hypothetical protein WAP35_04685 [Solirubrobacterales bacterium]